MKCLDLKCFIPSKNYLRSCEFYIDLGFIKNWDAGSIAEFQIGEFRFLLQDFYVKEHAENFVVHLLVDNAEIWFEKFQNCVNFSKYSEVKLYAPEIQPWGLITAYLTDPSGVLWHIVEKPEDTKLPKT